MICSQFLLVALQLHRSEYEAESLLGEGLGPGATQLCDMRCGDHRLIVMMFLKTFAARSSGDFHKCQGILCN
jgi:hypothetical protein